MRKHTLTFLFFLVFVPAVKSQTTIALTFSGRLFGNHYPLDSINIINLTQGGDTTISGSDTVLILDHGIGIQRFVSNDAEQLVLYPCYPNPFTHTTNISFYLPEDEPVLVTVFDLSGREVATFRQNLQRGYHSFRFRAAKQTVYMLSVETRAGQKVQKMIHRGHSDGDCRLEYEGIMDSNYSGFRRGRSLFIWSPGDSLMFTGSSPMGIDVISDDPFQSTYYTFDFRHLK